MIGPESAGQVIVGNDLKIKSMYLQREVICSIILPEDYFEEKRDYPVVYLLHGFGGDHSDWIRFAGINDLIDSLMITGELCKNIYVLPDAGNTYYINNHDNSIRYEDFFIRELIPCVDSVYRTKDERSFRVLMGLSMGGYGSIILALRNPDKFGTVVALSAAVRNDELLMALSQPRYETLFSSVFGSQLQGRDRISEHWIHHSPYYLIDSLSAPAYTTISWYIICGESDGLLPATQAFHRLLDLHRIHHTYKIGPGDHNWDYWRSSAVPCLQYLNRKICIRP